MNSDTNPSLEVEPVLHTAEPVRTTYEDSLEGLLQFHADRSLWFKEQSLTAKTSFKREFYQKKLVKNNKNLWKLLVRTPNAYNPLMKFIEAEPKGEDFVHTSGYSQVVGDEIEVEAVMTTNDENGNIITIPQTFVAKSGGGQV